MPLLWLSLAFLCGLPLAALLRAPAWSWLAPAGVLAGLALLERWRPVPFLRGLQCRLVAPVSLLLLLAAALAGAGRMALAQQPLTPADLAYYNDRGPAVLTGWVASAPDRRERSTLVQVRVEQIVPEAGLPAAVDGLALAQLPAGVALEYGQRVELQGGPVTPPEDEQFSYRAYLARRGIHTLVRQPALQVLGPGKAGWFWRTLYDLRERAYRLVQGQYPQPESALMSGILLGLERDLPEELERAYQDTGTAHIIAISGFNLSILAALFIKGFGRLLPLGPASLAAGLTIGFYTLLVGANPAVVRAAIMSGLALSAALIGRRGAGLNSLALSAAVMALFNPNLPWDVSFQLSFGATLGLVLYGDRFETAFSTWCAARLPAGLARRVSRLVGDYLLLTLAAQVTTLPIMAYHFQRLSLSMLVANPLVLPVQPVVMVGGGLALLGGAMFAPLGSAAAGLVWPLAAYTNRAVSVLAEAPYSSVALGEVPLALALSYYCLLFGLPRLKMLGPAARRFVKPAAAAVPLALLVLLTWRGVLAAPRGLELTVLGLEGGPALLLRSPGGPTALLGGAASANDLSEALGRRLPLNDHSLDALVLTQSKAAALDGLPVTVERFPPERAYWAVEPPSRAQVDRLRASFAAGGSGQTRLQVGEGLAAGGWQLRVLADQGGRAALLLEGQGLRVLVPGGVEPEELGDVGRVHLLVLGVDDARAEVEQWVALRPQLALSLGGPAELPDGWIDLSNGGWLKVRAASGRVWLEQGR